MSELMPGPVRLAAALDGPRDAPVLVLGNSLGTTRDLWEPQLAALGEHFRLLRYEHRGHGGSPAPPGPYTLADLGADVLRLLDDFGVGARVVLRRVAGRDGRDVAGRERARSGSTPSRCAARPLRFPDTGSGCGGRRPCGTAACRPSPPRW